MECIAVIFLNPPLVCTDCRAYITMDKYKYVLKYIFFMHSGNP